MTAEQEYTHRGVIGTDQQTPRRHPRDVLIEAARMAAARREVDDEVIATIDRALAMIPVHDVDEQIGALLTVEERRVIGLTADLANALTGIVSTGRTREPDLEELFRSIHDIQARVLSQAAARAFPTQYRLLGSTL